MALWRRRRSDPDRGAAGPRDGRTGPAVPQPDLAWPAVRPLLPGQARASRSAVARTPTAPTASVPSAAGVRARAIRQHAPDPRPAEPSQRAAPAHPAAADQEFQRVPHPEPVPDEVDLSVLVPDDGWSAAVARQLEGEAASRLLARLAAATGSRPTKAWTTAIAELLQDPAAERALQVLLLRLGDCTGAPRAVSDSNADLARAAVWAGAETELSWVSPVLFAVGRRGLSAEGPGFASEKVLNATVQALGRIADDDAVHALQALSLSTRQGGQRAKLAAALEAAAARRGTPASDLVERVVPTHDLDEDGSVVLTSGSTRATVTVEDGGTLAVVWDGGGPKPPADAPAGEVAAVRRRVRVLRTAATEEARRVEGLLGNGRAWDDEEWSATYLDHPLVSRVSRHVLWRFGGLAALPWDRTQVLGLGGLVARPAGPVTLWDPQTAPRGEAEAWRAALAERGVVQPFAQV